MIITLEVILNYDIDDETSFFYFAHFLLIDLRF